MKKYELLKDDTVTLPSGKVLYRIRSLVELDPFLLPGDLGGYIESTKNLDQNGVAWVHGNARVYDNAIVRGNAHIFENAEVYGNAKVYGNAWICGRANVFDNARVYDRAEVYGDAFVRDDAQIYDGVHITVWNSRVYQKYVLKAVERDRPIKPRKNKTFTHLRICPVCGCPVSKDINKICPYCGQRLNWSE